MRRTAAARGPKLSDTLLAARPVRWPEERVCGGLSHAPSPYVQPYFGYPAVGSEAGCKVVSWNVKGLKRLLAKEVNLLGYLTRREFAQVVLLQETKTREGQSAMGTVEGLIPQYNVRFFHCKTRKDYGGTGVLTHRSQEVEDFIEGIPGAPEFSLEGRVVAVVLPKAIVLSVCSPHVGKNLTRLEARLLEWEPALRAYIKRLSRIAEETHKELLVAGTFNVAARDVDVANTRTFANRACCTDGEREAFQKLLQETGMIDTFRTVHSGGDWYSYWPEKDGARHRNYGLRLDYCLSRLESKRRLVHSSVLNAFHGSPHCPVCFTVMY